MREASGIRAASVDARRWAFHVLRSAIADVELASVTIAQARGFVRELEAKRATAKKGAETTARPLATQTKKNVLNLVRCAFETAVEEELLESNPFYGLRVRRTPTTTIPWTVLDVVEQRAILRAAPPHMRLLVGVALGTGMRAGELWGLEWCDVHVDGPRPHVVLRYSGHRKPTKSGVPRVVPLFGVALDAMRAHVEIVALKSAAVRQTENPLGLVFPRASGRPRAKGAPKGWHRWVKRAGIVRRVRFHDLRHTCGGSLVSGWWGRAWSLEEVRLLFGHSTIRMVERYSHFAADLLARAAREAEEQIALHQELSPMVERRGSDSNRRMTVLQTPTPPVDRVIDASARRWWE